MKVTNKLFELARAVTCFLDDHGIAFAGIPSGPVAQRCVPLRSPELRRYLYGEFDKKHSGVPGSSAYRDLLYTLEARAHDSELPRRALDTRIAADGPRFVPETIYLHLANDAGDAVEITDRGWNLRAAKSTYFRGSERSLPLPEPAAGGPPLDTQLQTLTGLPAAVREPCLDWIAAAMRPTGPYPVLVLKGPTGSGKSTLARLLRFTLDPCIDPLPNLPNTPRQVHALAEQQHILVFDHITHISRKLSEALCCTARPIILTMPDRTKLDPELANRAIVVALPEIESSQRRTEAEISATFHELHPQILGALCTLASQALAHMGETKLVEAPRHADAAAWVASAQTGQGRDPIRWTACLPLPPTSSYLPQSPDRSPGPAGST